MIKKGDSIPSVVLRFKVEDKIQERDAQDLFGSIKAVLFAVPGAFTPTCSALHLPGYIENREKFLEKGIQEIFCVAVNDPFVMAEWGRVQKVGDQVCLLSDGNGDFTRALGLTFDGSKFGMGVRSQRYAMILNHGVVEDIFVEAPGQFQVSSAEAVLSKI